MVFCLELQEELALAFDELLVLKWDFRIHFAVVVVDLHQYFVHIFVDRRLAGAPLVLHAQLLLHKFDLFV